MLIIIDKRKSAMKSILHKFLCRLGIFTVCAGIMLSLGSCMNDAQQDLNATTVTAAKTTVTEKNKGTGDLYVYFAASDSLNPFEAETAGNQQLASLMFDPLVRIDQNFNPELKIAESVSVNGKSVTVRLKDVNFSDGSEVTASDVDYSLGLAKKAKNGVYSDQLKIISNSSVTSSKELELTLSHGDPLIANVLDFPIIKEGSTKRKNKDDKELPPIGCGRYVMSLESGVYKLTGNKNYYGGTPQNVIKLSNTPDKDALHYSLRSGEVDIYYSGVMTGELLSMSGKTATVKQSNVVFLGLNYNGNLENKAIRRAIASALNRKEICSSAYYNYSEPALSLYNSSMSIIENENPLYIEESDKKTAEAQLKAAGYSKKDKDGYVLSGSGYKLNLTLLYNEDNAYQKAAAQLIAKQLTAVGINIALDARPYQNYLNCVVSRNYDLYLGEIKMNKDYDMSSLFSGNTVAGKTQKPLDTTTTAKPTTTKEEDKYEVVYSTDEDGDIRYNWSTATRLKTTSNTTAAKTTVNKLLVNVDMQKKYNDYLSGKIKLGSLLSTFAEETPFVPVAFRYGVVSYNSSLSKAAVSTVSDAYYNIEQLTVEK